MEAVNIEIIEKVLEPMNIRIIADMKVDGKRTEQYDI